jgi:transposase
MAKSKKYQSIPTFLHEDEFNGFVLPCLTKGTRGPPTKVSYHRLFNYILKLMHTGCQWEVLPIEKDAFGRLEIHYTRIFRTFQRWQKDGCFDKIFVNSVHRLFKSKLLDSAVIHGDGSTTVAKKGAIT